MTTFSDPYTGSRNAECKTSPDGKHVLLITTRGVIRTNQLRSTLWIYSTQQIDDLLHNSSESHLRPRPLLRVAGTPVAQQVDSYGSLIERAQWSMDSRYILALVEQKGGYRHIVQIPLSGKTPSDLTPGKVDVKDFAESGGTIAYTVVEHRSAPRGIGVPINLGSSDLTGLSLLHILFPMRLPDPASYWPGNDLWVRYKGRNRQINADGKWYFPTSAGMLRLSVSPDGKALIAARPVPGIRPDWFRYLRLDKRSWLDLSSGETDRSGKSFYWPWQYIYVRLDRMTLAPLVDAPSGIDAGYSDTPDAQWSRDGHLVLFTNSYLPLPATSEGSGSQSAAACAVAIYNTTTRTAACIVNAQFPAENRWLTSARFGASSSQVIIQWSGEGKNETDVYARTTRGWEFESWKAVTEEPQPDVRIFVKQDLNEPPVLWAAESKTGLAKELWDPNPQLASLQLGHASVYTWKDSSGYQWRAGLLLPPDYVAGRRYPLVIQTHGFHNEHEFLVDGSYTTGFAAQPLAASGIVVLQMEDRADRHTQPPGQEALLAVDGFTSAIKHLDEDGLIDPSRVGIIGFSRAAWYVEEALIKKPRLFRAATLIDGIDQSYVNYMLFAFSKASEETLDPEAANGGKPFGAGLQKWFRNAPGFNLNRVETPIRIEAIGPISALQEWETYSSLHEQGKPVDLVYIPKGQHILQSPHDRYASQQGNVDWFRFWLQDYQAPSVIGRREYLRWDKLRRLEEEQEPFPQR